MAQFSVYLNQHAATRELGEEVESLVGARHEIIAAIDFLLSGV